MICWLLLVLAGVPVPGGVPMLVSLFLSFPGQGFSSFMDLLVPPASGWVPVLVSLLFLPSLVPVLVALLFSFLSKQLLRNNSETMHDPLTKTG